VPRPKSPAPKTDALRSVGALNPHPAAVKDEIFAGSDFFDRRDLVQVRYEMVRRVRTDGRPIAETATRFGVSRPTYYKLSAEFEREGICGLAQEARSQGWPQTTCRGRRGVAGGAHAGPRRGCRLARGTREAAIRRRDPRADDRTRAQRKTLVSERAPGVGHERFPTERYEELRSTAFGVTAASNGRGLALLMRYGVVAWMRAWASCVAPRPTPPEPRGLAQLPQACPEMVRVLAEMAMAAAREGVVA